jgi:hypothetical protein
MVTQRAGVGQVPPLPISPTELKLAEISEKLSQLIDTVKVTATLPLDPETLNRILQGARRPGDERTWFPCWRLSWNCPAGAVTRVPLSLPAGWICTRRVAKLYATYYDPDISIEVLVDGSSVTAPFGLSLTGAIDLDFGEFLVKRDRIEVNTTNNSATDTLLSVEVSPSLLKNTYFQSFWEPLITLTYERLLGVLQ